MFLRFRSARIWHCTDLYIIPVSENLAGFNFKIFHVLFQDYSEDGRSRLIRNISTHSIYQPSRHHILQDRFLRSQPFENIRDPQSYNTCSASSAIVVSCTDHPIMCPKIDQRSSQIGSISHRTNFTPCPMRLFYSIRVCFPTTFQHVTNTQVRRRRWCRPRWVTPFSMFVRAVFRLFEMNRL